MTATLAHIWRYPIKAHGFEALKNVSIATGGALPWDRAWAVAHEATQADGTQWARCRNFSRGAGAPALMAIAATLNEAAETITLTHPDLPPITFSPDTEADKFIDWVRPIMPENRAASTHIIRVPDVPLADVPYPSISLCNLASNHAVGHALGQDLSPLRWRGNLWFDGLDPWAEFDWVGKRLRIGTVELDVIDKIKRCMAPTGNPVTGKRDVDTLKALNDNWGHQHLGVCAKVVAGGEIKLGDTLEVI